MRRLWILQLAALLTAPIPRPVSAQPGPRPFGDAQPASIPLGSTVMLSWNDLGMHCMNKSHADFSVLPPYNNLFAQVIARGDATHAPQLLTTGITVEYSVPGNTYSVGKTDFWTYAPALFGVTLPANVGLTGKGLSGSLDLSGAAFSAHGIPVTPWPDNDLVNEHPYQQALVIAHGAGGVELARSTPVIPVSTELSCVSSGCHSSINAILQGHDRVAGFDPGVRPILCAKCHASPALGTAGIPEANYFSFRMHDQHKFMDQTLSGTALCYKCHPGSNAQCLRGGMSTLHGLQCQSCHGGMTQVSTSIEAGRVPWVNEPSCGTCHLAAFAENPGTLFKNSVGHGGVMCEGCHNSTHADWPSRIDADNANVIALQGTAGPLSDCTVCHGTAPAGAGPHGILATTDVEQQVLGGAIRMAVAPNPMRGSCTVLIAARDRTPGPLLVYDAAGRVVRLLETSVAGAGLRASWDGRDQTGSPVRAGAYYLRWRLGTRRAGARVTVLR